MYCSDIKLAQSLEKDSVLEIPKCRALPWQSVWRRSPLPAWGGRVHGRESTCRGTGGGGGGTRLGGRQLCPGACCLPFPARHRIALRARLFCTALEPTQPRHGAIARLAKGCLGHGGARGGERDVFLKDGGKELCPAARCETSAGWPGAGRGY